MWNSHNRVFKEAVNYVNVCFKIFVHCHNANAA